MGVSIEKKFIKSIANTIGTDLSPYKIVKPRQFAYGPVTSRNGDKITIALYDGTDDCIISQAYEAFKITDENELLPEYLMMWAKRPEFDRYARYMSHGSVREMFTWEDMCNVMLPVPPIAEQRRIVDEYQTVERRIANNEALIQKLEETAQAIYHHTFVEGIDKENLPNGWKKNSLYEIADFLNGKPCQKYTTNKSDFIPVLKIRELGLGFTDQNSDKVINSFPEEYLIHCGDLVFSWSASLIVDFWCYTSAALNQHLFKVSSKKYPLWFCYLWIKHHINIWNNIITAKAVSMGHIKISDLQQALVLIPTENEIHKLDMAIAPLFEYMMNLRKENITLRKLLTLLTSKLA